MNNISNTYHQTPTRQKALSWAMMAVLAIVLSSCYEVTVQVSKVPGNTPSGEPIYIAGNFNNWDPGDSRYVLQKKGDSVYEVSLPRGIGPLEYKFTRGDWTTVEKDLCGFEINNRVLYYGREELVQDTIESWNDLPALDCPMITIVLDNLPENTPLESELSVAGNFNNWDPAGKTWSFTYDSAIRKPVLNLPRIGGNRTAELKITRGNLDRAESDAMGKEIQPRRIEFGTLDTLHIQVEGWEDLARGKGSQLTVLISRLPDNTPARDPIYITGSFNGWYPRSGDYRLEKNREGQYFINLPRRGEQFECKFTRGSWSTEEVDRWGFRTTNRVIGYDHDTVFVEIENWRDLKHPEGPPVKVVIDKIPADTPPDAELYLAGNFNNWNPGDQGYVFMRSSDGSYYIQVPRSEYQLEFKITRGNWGTVECRPDGDDIENRVYAYKETTEVRVTVQAWKDKAN